MAVHRPQRRMRTVTSFAGVGEVPRQVLTAATTDILLSRDNCVLEKHRVMEKSRYRTIG
jgi:hypothetical protein